MNESIMTMNDTNNKKTKDIYRESDSSGEASRIIVSFTSYPARITFVPRVLESLYAQSKKPDMILLWLAEEQFPNREEDLPDELIDAICRAAKKFCVEFMDEISDEWREEIEQKMTVKVNEDTPPLEMLKCFRCALIVDAPEDPSRIGYQLSGNCDWEEEHGIEIDILDDKLVYLSEYAGQSPWDDHSDEEWNYAASIYE